MLHRPKAGVIITAGLITLWLAASAQGQGGRGGAPAVTGAWSDKGLSPDQRADLVIEKMTLDEKIQLLHGSGGGRGAAPAALTTSRSNGGAGWVPGIERLGIPDINMADSAVGVTRGAAESRYSTLLPSSLGAAASWNPDLALLYGQVIGRELRDQGYNMSIGGGVNITREPRNGRNFEYAGEDPILAGTTVGTLMKGVQSQQIMGDLKHYALNDQETGRNIGNAILDKRSMRESDLLAFQIGYRISDASGFMCGYNKVNGDWDCENDYLLNQVLKKDFGFKGWVMSNWGGTHTTTKAIMAGLDQEQPGSGFFGDALKKAVESGEVPLTRINDAVHRILRSLFAVGVWDNPPNPRQVVDVFRGLEDAQKIAEESIVLLKNAGNQLPLSAAAVKSIRQHLVWRCNLIRVIQGTSRGTSPRKIVSNTATTLTWDLPMLISPGDVWIVEEPTWPYSCDTTSLDNGNPLAVTTINMPTSNFVDETLMIAGFTVDVNGNESPDGDAPIREDWVFGAEGLSKAAGQTVVVATPSQIGALSQIPANTAVSIGITAVGTTFPGANLSVFIYA